MRDQIHEARYYVDVDISGRKIEEKVKLLDASSPVHRNIGIYRMHFE